LSDPALNFVKGGGSRAAAVPHRIGAFPRANPPHGDPKCARLGQGILRAHLNSRRRANLCWGSAMMEPPQSLRARRGNVGAQSAQVRVVRAAPPRATCCDIGRQVDICFLKQGPPKPSLNGSRSS